MGNTFDRIPIKEQARGIVSAQRSTCALVCLVLTLLSALLGGLSAGVLMVLVSGLFQVAQSGFFLRLWRGESVGVADMLASMADDGFLRKVGGMLWVQLQVFLYSLLLMPYILADCPNVSATQASALSARMMYGHRMELFIAQLSFFGWLLLSGLTGGILYVLHVGPYMELTFAGIYEEIRQIVLDEGKVSQLELDGAAN